MENIGYRRALDMAARELESRAPEDVAEKTGVFWNGEGYEVPWFGQRTALEKGATDERIIWMHYMLAQGPRTPRGRYIAYKQVPGAAIYNDNFIKRCIQPMLKAFQTEHALFLEKGALLGGEPVRLGDAAFTFRPLPYVPLTFILWLGDEEMPANGNILFDETAIEWLCAEDLVVLAGQAVYKMIRMLKS